MKLSGFCHLETFTNVDQRTGRDDSVTLGAICCSINEVQFAVENFGGK